MKALDRGLLLLVKLMVLVGGLCMLLMMAQVTADVLLRWLFHAPITGTLEMVANYYMVALVFLPLGLVTYTRDHIIVELFTQGMGPRWKAGLTSAGNGLGFVYSAALTVFGTMEAIDMTLIGEAWSTGRGDILIWPSRWFVPAGCSVMAAYFLLHTLDDLTCAATGRRTLDADARESALYD